MYSVKCRVECKVERRNQNLKVKGVECVECSVQNVECGVQTVDCGV